jgi:4-azaleucine resistance transporter AzlC
MFRKAFPYTIPVLLGYLAIGIAFGLLLKNAGYPWYLAPIMSILVYAGALQYLAVGLLAANVSIAEAAILALVVNARHMVYGLSLLEKYKGAGLRKPYLVFALTDETYALVTSTEPPAGLDRIGFYAAVSLLDQCYWVAGSAIGAIAGSFLPFDMKGLDFALTALFVVLLVEQLKSCRSWVPFALAAACSLGAWFIAGPRNMLLASVVSTVVLLVVFRKEIVRNAA